MLLKYKVIRQHALNQKVRELLDHPETVKILATTDENGVPYVVIKQSLELTGEGNLAIAEMLESSRTNRNLVRSLWFDQKVAIHLKGLNGQSFQIKGKPYQCIISGPLFDEWYRNIRSQYGPDFDLAAVWIIHPEEVFDQSLEARVREEEERRPYLKHLDRLRAEKG